VTMKSAPPGWEPNQIATRIDGYITGHGDRVPDAVPELIARAMPQPGDNTLSAIRARMFARHIKALGHV
jgi:hypothetical protein